MGDKGSILLSTFVVSAMILVAMVGYTPFLTTVLQSTRFSYLRDQSFTLAEAGLAHARWEILSNNAAFLKTATNGWTNVRAALCDDELDGGSDKRLYGLAVSSCQRLTGTLSAGDPAGGPVGTYTVWVANYGSPLVRLVSRATVTALPTASYTVSLDLEQPVTFKYAAFGGRTVTVAGAVSMDSNVLSTFIDSYDSRQGPYDSLLNHSDHGDIGTNGDGTSNADLWVIPYSKGFGDSSLSAGALGIKILGTGWITPNDTYTTTTASSISRGVVTQPDVALPHVQIPSTLDALPITTTLNSPLTVQETGQGDFTVTGTYTCDQSLHIRTLIVQGGTFRMTDQCQLLIDGGYLWTAPGWMRKTGTGATRIFLRDASFGIGTVGYDSAIPLEARLPKNLQIYATFGPTYQATHPGIHNMLGTGEEEPFLGVVYADGGDYLVLYTGQYYGSFICNDNIIVQGEGTPWETCSRSTTMRRLNSSRSMAAVGRLACCPTERNAARGPSAERHRPPTEKTFRL